MSDDFGDDRHLTPDEVGGRGYYYQQTTITWSPAQAGP